MTDTALILAAQADREYTAAFRQVGIDVDARPVKEAVDRITAHRAIAAALLPALDDWVAIRSVGKDEAATRRLTDVLYGADPDPWRRRVREAWAHKDWPALDNLVTSADLDRQPAATLTFLYSVLTTNQQFSLTRELVLQRAQWKYPADFWINHRLGVDLMWRQSPNEVREGIGYMRAAVALRPESSHAMINLGNGHHFLGRYDAAEACYRKAIELNPKSANAHTCLGNALAWQEKLGEAVASHRKAIELDPKFAAAHSNLGKSLAMQGKVDEAIDCYRKAIELDPNNAAAHTNLGNALARQGKLGEAVASHRKAIELDPKFAAAHSNLGNTLARQGKLDEAIASYKKAIELDPKFANAHNNLGLALMKKGQMDESIASYGKAVELDPKNVGARNELAWLLATCPDPKFRDPKRAVELAQKAIELAPKDGSYWNTLGIAHYRAAEWQDASDALKKSDELLQGEMFSFNAFFLAMAGWQLGEKEAARKWYEQAAQWMEKNKPEDEELKRFREEAAELLGVKDK